MTDANGKEIKVGDKVKLRNVIHPGKGAADWVVHHVNYNDHPAEVVGFGRTRVKVFLPDEPVDRWAKELGRTVTIAPEYLIVLDD